MQASQVDATEIYLRSQPCRILAGSGSPEDAVTAGVCSVYLRTDDGGLYVKTSGSGDTGWTVASGLPDGAVEGTVLAGSDSGPEWSTDPTVNSTTVTGTAGLAAGTGYLSNIGSLTSKFLTVHAAELWVQSLVASNTMATVGGRVLVAPTTQLTADLDSGGTSIAVKHNQIANGDRVVLEANGQVEFLAVTSGSSGSGPYTYSVTRNLDGSGANDWPAGSALVNTGTTGDGHVDLCATNGLLPGSTAGPTIVGNVRTGTTYSAVAPRWALGNLNGTFGYGSDTYGFAAGDSNATNVTVDATNGFRIRNGSATPVAVDASGNASFAGSITASAGTIGGWSLGPTSLSSSRAGVYAFANTAGAYNLSGSDTLARAFSSGRWPRSASCRWRG